MTLLGDSCSPAENRSNADPGPETSADVAVSPDVGTFDPGAMVPVAPGPFLMGCDETSDPLCHSTEQPAHQVSVPGFEIDLHEVTVGAYLACLTAGKCTGNFQNPKLCDWSIPGRESYPITCISRDEAAAFCAWVGKRLCTEAEWEKAARGTDGRMYPWGNQAATCDLAVMPSAAGDGCGTYGPMAVGSKPAGASPYGALDMAGNVWEIVADFWHESYVGAPTDGSEWKEGASAGPVVRGGSYDFSPKGLRAAARRICDGFCGSPTIGFRCCR